jgi:hypothetical protein
VAAHQAGKRLFHWIRSRFLLCLQCVLRDVLDGERFSTDFFKDVNHLQRAERLRPAQFQRGVPCCRVVQALHGKLGHVLERDPTDCLLARSIDAGLSVGGVKANRRTEPNLHKVAGTQDGVDQTAVLELPLHRALGVPERKVEVGLTRKRDIDKARHVGSLRRSNEGRQSLQVHRLDVVLAGLVRKGHRGRGRYHRADALARGLYRSTVAQIATDEFGAKIPERLYFGRVGRRSKECSDWLALGGETTTYLATHQACCSYN